MVLNGGHSAIVSVDVEKLGGVAIVDSAVVKAGRCDYSDQGLRQ